MATRAVIIFSVCLILSKFVTGQFLKEEGQNADVIVDVKTAQEKWLFMEERMKGLANDAMKMLLPRLMDVRSTLNISSTCIKNGLEIIGGIKKLKAWAVKFVDASSKSIDGIMGSTFASFGDFDECLENTVINQRPGKHEGEILFQGKYCRVEASPYLPPKPRIIYLTDRLEEFKNFTNDDKAMGYLARFAHVFYSLSLVFGLCVPSGCSKNDVNQLLHEAGNYLGIVIRATRCEIKEERKLTPVMIGVISLYSFALCLVVIASLVDLYCHYSKTAFKGKGIKLLCSFSFITNFRKFTDTTASSGTFSCLHGIRSLTISWIILGHTYLIAAITAQSLPSNIEEFLQEFAFQAVLNGTFSVDTFFFMGGMLLCYGTTKLIKNEKKPFNFITYVIHRLWRILPTYAFVIAFLFLGPLLGSGPIFRETTDFFIQSCERNWWANLLFINNFYDTENMCMGQGWYLAVDMQFYLGALIILLPLMRWPKLGISIAVSTILASMLGSALHTYIRDFPPAAIVFPDAANVVKYSREFFMKPHCHAGPYCIGILCGYLLAMHPKLKIPKVVQLFGWCLTIVFPLCVVNGVQRWHMGVTPTFWQTIFYSSCHRVAWSLSVAWVIVSCSTGHGGIVNQVLSWKIWIPMGRLTFLAYLLNPLVMVFYSANIRKAYRIDHITAVWLFFGHLGITYLAAFGGTMLIEAPFLSLEKVLFSREKDTLLSATSQDSNTAGDGTLAVKNGVITVLSKKDHVSEEKNGVANSTFVCRL